MKEWNLPDPKLKEKQDCFVIRFNNPTILKIPVLDESKRTAIRDLNQLVKLGVVVQMGSVTGRGRYYIIKVTKGDRKSKENNSIC